MKISNYILWVICLSCGILTFIIYKNQTGTVSDILGSNLGFITSLEDLNYSLQYRKQENLKNILLKGGVILFAEILVFLYFKKEENKLNPIINLKSLKDNGVLSQEEYERKLSEVSEIILKEKGVKLRAKETKKLISELANLKAKGIITEEEYLKKVEVVEKQNPITIRHKNDDRTNDVRKKTLEILQQKTKNY